MKVNLGCYTAALACLPVLTFVQYYHHGRVFRDELYQSSLPLKFVNVDLENAFASNHAQDMYMAATTCFTFSTLYWQLKFIASLEGTEYDTKV